MTETLPSEVVEPSIATRSAPAQGRPGHRPARHRVAGIALVVLGGYLVVLPFALSLFDRAPDAEHLADRYRGFASAEGLARFRANTQEVVDGGQQLLDAGLPSFAADLGMTETELAAHVDRTYPAVGVFRHRAPEVFGYLVPAVDKTAQQADDVAAADDFPAPGVPVTVGPWALLLSGLVLIGAGSWMLASGRGAATVVALVVGTGLVVAPLALGWPQKVDAAEHVAEAARVGFDLEVARATNGDTSMIDAAVLELNHAMLPAIAEELGITEAELHQRLARELPATERFLADWQKRLSPAAHGLAQSQLRDGDAFRDADATPYRALPWLFVVPGVLVLTGVGVAALADRRR